MELFLPIWSKHASKLYEYSRHKPEESALYRLVFNCREEFEYRYQELFEVDTELLTELFQEKVLNAFLERDLLSEDDVNLMRS